jgi:hypothetical protein
VSRQPNLPAALGGYTPDRVPRPPARKPRKPKRIRAPRGPRLGRPTTEGGQAPTRSPRDKPKPFKGRPETVGTTRGSVTTTTKPKPDWLAAPLTEAQALARVDAAAGMRFDPLSRELDAQQRISDQHTRNVGSWYEQYQNKKAQQNVAGLSQGMANIDAQQRNAQLADLQQQMAVSGNTVSPEAAQRANDASAARRAMNESFGAMLAQNMASAGQAGQANLAGAGAAQLHASLESRQRDNQIARQRQDLTRERGQYRVTALEEFRQKERDVQLKQVAAQLNAETEQLALAIAADNNAAERKSRENIAALNALNARLIAQSQNASREAIAQLDNRTALATAPGLTDDPDDPNNHAPRAPSRGSGGRSGGLTPTQRRNYRSEYNKALTLARSRRPRTEAQARSALTYMVDTKGFDADIAWAAISVAWRGGVTPTRRRTIQRDFGLAPPIAGTISRPTRPG